MHAQVSAAKTDHHIAIVREPRTRDAPETQLTQPGEQLVGRPRNRRIEAELELRRITIAAEKTRQRLKHFVGPGTNA